MVGLEDSAHPTTPYRLRSEEQRLGMEQPGFYAEFADRVTDLKRELRDLLRSLRAQGKRAAAYGASAKGSTLLNYFGIGRETLEFVADRNPAKQGTFLPGSRIPVRAPQAIFETKPDWVLILPWNLSDEIAQELSGIRRWGGRFVTMVPTVQTTP